MAASYRPGANKFANDAAMRRLQAPQPQPAAPTQAPAGPPPQAPAAQPQAAAPSGVSSFLPSTPLPPAPQMNAQPPRAPVTHLPPGYKQMPQPTPTPYQTRPQKPTGNAAFDFFMRNNPQYRR
jgi:hypothetical protein